MEPNNEGKSQNSYYLENPLKVIPLIWLSKSIKVALLTMKMSGKLQFPLALKMSGKALIMETKLNKVER
jgi:hypothetical protein